MFYKLYARTYGGKHDGNIQGRHQHIVEETKFVNLFDIMRSLFHGKGHHVTCDSAYIIYEWHHGTDHSEHMEDQHAWNNPIQSNQMGAQMDAYLKTNPIKKWI